MVNDAEWSFGWLIFLYSNTWPGQGDHFDAPPRPWWMNERLSPTHHHHLLLPQQVPGSIGHHRHGDWNNDTSASAHKDKLANANTQSQIWTCEWLSWASGCTVWLDEELPLWREDRRLDWAVSWREFYSALSSLSVENGRSLFLSSYCQMLTISLGNSQLKLGLARQAGGDKCARFKEHWPRLETHLSTLPPYILFKACQCTVPGKSKAFHHRAFLLSLIWHSSWSSLSPGLFACRTVKPLTLSCSCRHIKSN